MANHQLYPLEVNPHTGEPFLRLNNHSHIIITPPRPSDMACYPPILNDPRVHEWLIGPPIPYLPRHAEAWFEQIKGQSDALLSELEAAKNDTRLITVGICPVRSIREVVEGGKDVYLGDISIDRYTNEKLLVVLGPEVQGIPGEQNEQRAVGDPNIIWTIGDYLIPSHHGQGIMTDVIQTVLHNWAIPRMGVRKITAEAFVGNEGSVKVFQKNDFHLTRTLQNYAEIRGRTRHLHVLEWDFDKTKKLP